MTSMDRRYTVPQGNVRWQTVALPAEHGGWSFLLEPILLGLLLAPTWAGAMLATASIAAFLLHQPLFALVQSYRRGRKGARFRLARQFVVFYAGVSLFGLATATGLAGTVRFLQPFLYALPLAAIYLFFDLKVKGRTLAGELAASALLAAIVASLVLLDAGSPAIAYALWLLVVARGAPAILYVRCRLRLEKGKPTNVLPPLAAHGAALVAAVVLATLDVVPYLAVAPFALLLARASIGLSPYRRRVPATTVGITELGWGAVTVGLLARAVDALL